MSTPSPVLLASQMIVATQWSSTCTKQTKTNLPLQAVNIAMEEPGSKDAILPLLSAMSESGEVTSSQMQKGFQRCALVPLNSLTVNQMHISLRAAHADEHHKAHAHANCRPQGDQQPHAALTARTLLISALQLSVPRRVIDNLAQTALDVPAAPAAFRDLLAAARSAGLVDDSLQAPSDEQLKAAAAGEPAGPAQQSLQVIWQKTWFQNVCGNRSSFYARARQHRGLFGCNHALNRSKGGGVWGASRPGAAVAACAPVLLVSTLLVCTSMACVLLKRRKPQSLRCNEPSPYMLQL